MAMTICKECKNEISTKAQMCPKCGAKIVKTSLITKIFLGIIVLATVMSIIASNKASKHREEAAQAEQARLAALSPEQRAKEAELAKARADKEQKISAQADMRREQTLRALKAVNTSLLDPSSAIWKAVRASDEGETVCIAVAAKNGFGGLTLTEFTAHKGVLSKDASAWQKYCVGQSMFDEIKLTKYL